MPSDSEALRNLASWLTGAPGMLPSDIERLRKIADRLDKPEPVVSLAAQLYARQQETFASRLTDFLHEWGPDDPSTAVGQRFQGETYTLIQMAQALAQQPLIDRICEINEKVLNPPMIVKDGKAYVYDPRRKP